MAESTTDEHRPEGYDEDFVEAVDEDLQCLICHLPLKEPIQTRCGHRFCKDCLEEYIRRHGSGGQSIICPADRQSLDQDRDVFPDKATERKILSLVIKCPSEGCGWTGELRNKEVHLKSCSFVLLVCNNFSCGAKVQRKHLEQHQLSECPGRILFCEYCSEPHPECQMQDHIKKCNRFPITCPNSCGRSVPRETVFTHSESECPLTVISCPYLRMGCETRVQRRAVESHLDSAVRGHLDLVNARLQETEVDLNITKVRLETAEIKLIKTEDAQRNTETELNKTKNELDKALSLLHITNKELDKIAEKVNTTTFVWKIRGFSEILRQAKICEKETLHSDPFHTKTGTESYGYKLKVTINPNGFSSGKDTHLSVCIRVIKGEYDAILPWPFNKIVKFTLIDQQEDPEQQLNVSKSLHTLCRNVGSFSRPLAEENKGRGFLRFISHEELKTRRYIVDNTLFLQVAISPPSL